MKSTHIAFIPQCNYLVLETEVPELGRLYPNGLEQIQSRKIDGILIRSALTPEQRNVILKNLRRLSPDKKFEIHGCGGFLYPITFNQLRPDDNYPVYRKRYFSEARDFRENFVRTFEMDIEGIVGETLTLISGGRTVKVAPGMFEDETMMPATIRVFEPGRGGVFPHCHNTYDEDLHPDFVRHFNSILQLRHQLSFFISVNKPDKGGQITLFNIEHKDAKRKRGNTDILKNDGTIFDTSQLSNKNVIEMEEGDMIIFAGGDIWHQVEDIGGSKNRITIGGFGSFSKDNSTFYYWS